MDEKLKQFLVEEELKRRKAAEEAQLRKSQADYAYEQSHLPVSDNLFFDIGSSYDEDSDENDERLWKGKRKADKKRKKIIVSPEAENASVNSDYYSQDNAFVEYAENNNTSDYIEQVFGYKKEQAVQMTAYASQYSHTDLYTEGNEFAAANQNLYGDKYNQNSSNGAVETEKVYSVPDAVPLDTPRLYQSPYSTQHDRSIPGNQGTPVESMSPNEYTGQIETYNNPSDKDHFIQSVYVKNPFVQNSPDNVSGLPRSNGYGLRRYPAYENRSSTDSARYTDESPVQAEYIGYQQNDVYGNNLSQPEYSSVKGNRHNATEQVVYAANTFGTDVYETEDRVQIPDMANTVIQDVYVTEAALPSNEQIDITGTTGTAYDYGFDYRTYAAFVAASEMKPNEIGNDRNETISVQPLYQTFKGDGITPESVDSFTNQEELPQIIVPGTVNTLNEAEPALFGHSETMDVPLYIAAGIEQDNKNRSNDYYDKQIVSPAYHSENELVDGGIYRDADRSSSGEIYDSKSSVATSSFIRSDIPADAYPASAFTDTAATDTSSDPKSENVFYSQGYDHRSYSDHANNRANTVYTEVTTEKGALSEADNTVVFGESSRELSKAKDAYFDKGFGYGVTAVYDAVEERNETCSGRKTEIIRSPELYGPTVPDSFEIDRKIYHSDQDYHDNYSRDAERIDYETFVYHSNEADRSVFDPDHHAESDETGHLDGSSKIYTTPYSTQTGYRKTCRHAVYESPESVTDRKENHFSSVSTAEINGFPAGDHYEDNSFRNAVDIVYKETGNITYENTRDSEKRTRELYQDTDPKNSWEKLNSNGEEYADALSSGYTGSAFNQENRQQNEQFYRQNSFRNDVYNETTIPEEYRLNEGTVPKKMESDSTFLRSYSFAAGNKAAIATGKAANVLINTNMTGRQSYAVLREDGTYSEWHELVEISEETAEELFRNDQHQGELRYYKVKHSDGTYEIVDTEGKTYNDVAPKDHIYMSTKDDAKIRQEKEEEQTTEMVTVEADHERRIPILNPEETEEESGGERKKDGSSRAVVFDVDENNELILKEEPESTLKDKAYPLEAKGPDIDLDTDGKEPFSSRKREEAEETLIKNGMAVTVQGIVLMKSSLKFVRNGITVLSQKGHDPDIRNALKIYSFGSAITGDTVLAAKRSIVIATSRSMGKELLGKEYNGLESLDKDSFSRINKELKAYGLGKIGGNKKEQLTQLKLLKLKNPHLDPKLLADIEKYEYLLKHAKYLNKRGVKDSIKRLRIYRFGKNYLINAYLADSDPTLRDIYNIYRIMDRIRRARTSVKGMYKYARKTFQTAKSIKTKVTDGEFRKELKGTINDLKNEITQTRNKLAQAVKERARKSSEAAKKPFNTRDPGKKVFGKKKEKAEKTFKTYKGYDPKKAAEAAKKSVNAGSITARAKDIFLAAKNALASVAAETIAAAASTPVVWLIAAAALIMLIIIIIILMAGGGQLDASSYSGSQIILEEVKNCYINQMNEIETMRTTYDEITLTVKEERNEEAYKKKAHQPSMKVEESTNSAEILSMAVVYFGYDLDSYSEEELRTYARQLYNGSHRMSKTITSTVVGIDEETEETIERTVANVTLTVNYFNSIFDCVLSEGYGDFVDAGSVELTVWLYFRNLGFSEEATAGIMGNIYQESRFDPACIQGNGRGPAAGLFQWENYNTMTSRFKSLYDYTGGNWTDLKMTLEFAYKEMVEQRDVNWTNSWGGTNFSSAGATPTTLSAFMTSTDVEMACRQFEAAFERAGKPLMSTRINAARGYYEQFHGITSSGNDIIDYASSFIGAHYIYGGNTICYDWSDGVGIDCSAFVTKVLVDCGYLPSSAMPRLCKSTNFHTDGHGTYVGTDPAAALPGDVIVWNGHVAFYMGDGNIIHAANPSAGVKISKVSQQTNLGRIIGIRRFTR